MKSEKGFSLIEVLISVAIIGLVASTFLGALSTSSRALFITDERTTAKNIAESQLEYVKNLEYDPDGIYNPDDIPPEYPGYSATINTVSLRDGNIQEISVTVDHHGNPVITLTGYKAFR